MRNNKRKTKFALNCTFQKVFRTLELGGRKKLVISFYFKLIGIV